MFGLRFYNFMFKSCRKILFNAGFLLLFKYF